MHACWEQTLRRAVEELPTLHFDALKSAASSLDKKVAR
jgi:hypothetical protein